MSGKVINLRTRRKQKDRDAARAASTRSAAVHGIDKQSRIAAREENDRQTHRLEDHRLEDHRLEHDPSEPEPVLDVSGSAGEAPQRVEDGPAPDRPPHHALPRGPQDSACSGADGRDLPSIKMRGSNGAQSPSADGTDALPDQDSPASPSANREMEVQRADAAGPVRTTLQKAIRGAEEAGPRNMRDDTDRDDA